MTLTPTLPLTLTLTLTLTLARARPRPHSCPNANRRPSHTPLLHRQVPQVRIR